MTKRENPIKQLQAKTKFTGTCGHAIEAGESFVLVEPRPAFCCMHCATHPAKRSEQREGGA